MSEPRIHVPGRELGEPKRRPARARKSAESRELYARFTFRIRVHAESPTGLWRRARRVEQLVRELAPAGTEVDPVELVGRQGPNGREFRRLMVEAGRGPASWPAPRPAVGSDADSSKFVPAAPRRRRSRRT